MNAIENKNLRHAYITLLFGNSKLKYWNDEGLKELAKESAEMMLADNWEAYYNNLKKKSDLGKPDRDPDGIWYNTPIGVSLRIDFREGWVGRMYVDG